MCITQAPRRDHNLQYLSLPREPFDALVVLISSVHAYCSLIKLRRPIENKFLFLQHAGLLWSVCRWMFVSALRVSDVVRPQAQDGERPAVFAQEQSDLVIVWVGVQRLIVLLVLHLVLRCIPSLPCVADLRGARLCGAFLSPLGASVLEPHLHTKAGIHVCGWKSWWIHLCSLTCILSAATVIHGKSSTTPVCRPECWWWWCSRLRIWLYFFRNKFRTNA